MMQMNYCSEVKTEHSEFLDAGHVKLLPEGLVIFQSAHLRKFLDAGHFGLLQEGLVIFQPEHTNKSLYNWTYHIHHIDG